MLRALYAGLGLLLAATAPALSDPCPGPAGFYAGVALSPDGTRSEITVNLMCENGRYTAQFFAPPAISPAAPPPSPAAISPPRSTPAWPSVISI